MLVCLSRYAPVAQPDRVRGYEPRDRGFESLQACQLTRGRTLIEFVHGYIYALFACKEQIKYWISKFAITNLEDTEIHQSSPMLGVGDPCLNLGELLRVGGSVGVLLWFE